MASAGELLTSEDRGRKEENRVRELQGKVKCVTVYPPSLIYKRKFINSAK